MERCKNCNAEYVHIAGVKKGFCCNPCADGDVKDVWWADDDVVEGERF